MDSPYTIDEQEIVISNGSYKVFRLLINQLDTIRNIGFFFEKDDAERCGELLTETQPID